MGSIVTASRESTDYRYLLTRLVSNIVDTHEITEKNIEALVNFNGEGLSENDQQKQINFLKPRAMPVVLGEYDTTSTQNKLERAESIFSMLAEFQPSTDDPTPYRELIHLFGEPIRRQSVYPVTHFHPHHVHANIGANFMDNRGEIPESFDMLATSEYPDISNLYFAAIQKTQGFCPTHSDRLQENMMSYMFFHGITPEEFKFMIDMDHSLNDDDPAGNAFMRLESDYMKKYMFYGNINPGDMDEFGFFIRFNEELQKMQSDYEMKELYAKHIGYEWRRDFGNIILDDLVQFLGWFTPHNLERLFLINETKNFEDILDLYYKDMKEYPMLLKLNKCHIQSDENYLRLCNFIINSTGVINELDSQYKIESVRAVQRMFFDNHLSIYEGMDGIEDYSVHLFAGIAQSADEKGGLPSLRGDSLSALYKISYLFREKGTNLFKQLLSEDSQEVYDNSSNIIPAFSNEVFRATFAEYIEGSDDSKMLFNFFTNFGSETNTLAEKVGAGLIELGSVKESLNQLLSNGIEPTVGLVSILDDIKEEEKIETITGWKELIDNRFYGEFDIGNELFVQLAYTQFLTSLNNPKFNDKRDNDFELVANFDNYLDLLTANSSTEKVADGFHFHMEQMVDFELDCAAYESSLLMNFIHEVKCKADLLQRDVLVVPNLSNGYVAVAPIYDELIDLGVKIVMGAKVGSSESHHNPNVFNPNLFEGLEEYILDNDPIILVADGTQRMVSKDDADNEFARYPDAHRGYLNYTVALNKVKGFDGGTRYMTDEEYKSLETLYSFIEFVGKHSDSQRKRGEDYQFGLWNTQELQSLLVDGHGEKYVHMFSADDVTGPTVIFCNVGVFDRDIPQIVKDNHSDRELHTPAYFDDTGKIINLTLEVTSEGISYCNRFEQKLIDAYEKYGFKNNGKETRIMNVHKNHLSIPYTVDKK